MKEKTIDLKYGKLHIIKTSKFRTISVKVVLKNKFKKENITKNNFLTDYLTMSTKKYPTRRELALRTQELYSLFLGAYTNRRGNFFLTNFNLSFLDPKYTEESMLEDSFQLLHEVLFNPNVKNMSFDTAIFNVVRDYIESEIKTVKENSKAYATMKMQEIMGEDKPYAYNGYGYMEDLKAITPKNLYEYYKEILKCSDVDIYVVGNVKIKEIEDIVLTKLNFKTIKKDKGNINLEEEKPNRKIKEVIEESNFSQSKLAIGCKFYGLTEKERKYVLNLYNLILGGDYNSLLMKEVRENKSLAYYVGSTINKPDNTMTIQSGISYKNYKKTVKIIKEIMKDLTNKLVSEELLNSAKVEYISILDELDDNIDDILEYFYLKDLLNLDTKEERIDIIKNITTKEIMEVAKKVYIDTIYLLKGDSNEKN